MNIEWIVDWLAGLFEAMMSDALHLQCSYIYSIENNDLIAMDKLE